MARLGSVAFIALFLPAAGWSSPPPSASGPARTFHLQQPASDRFAPDGRIGRTEIAPNTQFGFGIFGLQSDKTQLRPVTGREIDAPKQRRAAVGFSLRF